MVIAGNPGITPHHPTPTKNTGKKISGKTRLKNIVNIIYKTKKKYGGEGARSKRYDEQMLLTNHPNLVGTYDDSKYHPGKKGDHWYNDPTSAMVDTAKKAYKGLKSVDKYASGLATKVLAPNKTTRKFWGYVATGIDYAQKGLNIASHFSGEGTSSLGQIPLVGDYAQNVGEAILPSAQLLAGYNTHQVKLGLELGGDVARLGAGDATIGEIAGDVALMQKLPGTGISLSHAIQGFKATYKTFTTPLNPVNPPQHGEKFSSHHAQHLNSYPREFSPHHIGRGVENDDDDDDYYN